MSISDKLNFIMGKIRIFNGWLPILKQLQSLASVDAISSLP